MVSRKKAKVSKPKKDCAPGDCPPEECDGTCIGADAKKIWIIGITAIIVISVLCAAIFSANRAEEVITPQHGTTGATVAAFGVQDPLMNPYGAGIAPRRAPAFGGYYGGPGYGAMQGNFAPVAAVNPNCAVCPNVTQCFPGQNPAQRVALTQPGAAPPITRHAQMPHGYRGVCSNCHKIL